MKTAGKPLPIIWNHDWDDPFAHIGHADHIEETDEGLLVEAQLDLENPTAVQVWKLLASGRVSEFSFSAAIPDDGIEFGEEYTRLTRLDLIEAGPTLKGANPETRLLEIKNYTEGLIQKEGRVLAQRHVDTLKEIHDQLAAIISAVEKTEDKSADKPDKTASTIQTSETEPASDETDGDGKNASDEALAADAAQTKMKLLAALKTWKGEPL